MSVQRGWSKALVIGVLAGGISGCGEQLSEDGVDFDARGFDGFTSVRLGLLATPCTIDASGNLTLTIVGAETAYVTKRASDSKVVANATIGGLECVIDS